MNYSRISKTNKRYFDDLEDTDRFLWQPMLSSENLLRPTEDWQHDFQAHLANRSPQTAMKLRRRDTPVKGMGFALTLPKCVSVLELLDIDPRLSAAVVTAAQVCLDFVTLITAPAGIVPDGKTASVVVAYAAFQRLTKAALPAPHRHVHFGVLSLAMHPELQRVTGANLGLFKHAGDLLLALFQHTVAWEAAKLGYVVDTVEDSFNVRGFTRELVERFSSGPRPGTAKDFALRPANYFQEQNERWCKLLTKTERAELSQLCRFKPNLEPELPFAVHLNIAANTALRSDFFVPVDKIAAQALRDTFGQMPADISLLARCVTGELPGELDAKKFQIGDRWCWSTPAGLREERQLFELVRGLSPAREGWISGTPSQPWWSKVLAADHHRVAVLRGDLDKSQLAALRKTIGRPQFLFIEDVETAVALRQKAREITAHLQAGGRVLFLEGVKKGKQSLWLKQLPHDAGVPLLRKGQRERLEVKGKDVSRISFAAGTACEIFAGSFTNHKSAYLLTAEARLKASNLEIRQWRRLAAVKPNQKGVKRLALVPTAEPLRPGLCVQFNRNTGGIMASETMTVLKVMGEGIQVQRAHGLQAFIPVAQLGRLTVFDPQEMELVRGDRIRLTRNNGPKPMKSGLRSGRHFEVHVVKPDGTVCLNDARTLPAEAGHWEYGFCAAIEGPKLRAGRVVCDAADLPLVASWGWLESKLHVVVCAATASEAQAALNAVISPVREKLLPDTDRLCIEAAIRVEIADAEKRLRSGPVKPDAVPQAAAPPVLVEETSRQIESPILKAHEISI